MTIDVEEVRASIDAERERLKKRPVPTTPWVMPLSLDDIEELLDAYEQVKKS